METINYEAEGTVFNIQRYSIHDGPGIRTIVFLKGCPLSCRWCSNPESQDRQPQVTYNKSQCTGCLKCVPVCPNGAISPKNPRWINREVCIGCGACARTCITKALELKGEKMSVKKVVEILKKDSAYYDRSDGGITLSGGEPLLQPDFVTELLKACQSYGWHTAIETTGFTSENVVRQVFPYVDLALLDIKNVDGNVHRQFTNCSNERILSNAGEISGITKTVIRIPVVPGFNMDQETIKRTCDFARGLHNIETIHLLPYHTYGENKYELIGREYPLKGISDLKNEDLYPLKEVVENEGFHCVIGG